MSEKSDPSEITYTNSVRNFDHRKLTNLPAYPRLRQALSDFFNEASEHENGLLLADGLRAITDMALTSPYADHCTPCWRRQDTEHDFTWPHAVDREGDWLAVGTAARSAGMSGCAATQSTHPTTSEKRC